MSFMDKAKNKLAQSSQFGNRSHRSDQDMATAKRQTATRGRQPLQLRRLLQLACEPLPCVRSERQRSTLTVFGVAH